MVYLTSVFLCKQHAILCACSIICTLMFIDYRFVVLVLFICSHHLIFSAEYEKS